MLVGGLGAVGGYFAASGLSAVLQPIFGWRILWLANLPTGLSLILLGALILESAKFLLARGAGRRPRPVMRRFGATVRRGPVPVASGRAGRPLTGTADDRQADRADRRGADLGPDQFRAAAVAADAIWSPRAILVAVSSRLLAESSLIAFPTVFLAAALMYSRWSTKWSLVTMIGVTLAGLLGVLRLELRRDGQPGAAGRAADRRVERHPRHPAALYGRELPAARAGQGDRLGCRLHQGGRAARAGAEHRSADPVHGAGGGDHHGARRRLALGLVAWFGRETVAAICATWRGPPASGRSLRSGRD